MKIVKPILLLSLGALIGAVAVLLLTKAVPNMMAKMCERMKREGKSPMDMCRAMMGDSHVDSSAESA